MNSKKEKNIILHVGLAKTASTFLQKKVFSHIKDSFFMYQGDELFLSPTFIDLQEINIPYHFNRSLNNTIHDGDYFNEKVCMKIRGFFEKNINQENILISHEGFVGCGEKYHTNFNNNTEIIKKLFPDAKIFLVVRNQSDWIESYYKQFIIGQNITLNHAVAYKNGNFDPDNNMLNVHKLDWLKMHEHYIQEFGKENVLTLPYEMLKNDLEDFLNRFYDFSCLSPFIPEKVEYINKRNDSVTVQYKPFLFYYQNFLNKLKSQKLKLFIEKNDRSIKKFLSLFSTINLSNEKLSKNQRELIKKIHAESNKMLSEKIGIDLQKYNYY